MRVGIYNRHLATLGGGERYSLAIAQALRSSMEVEIIAHQPVDLTMAAERLRLQLDGIRLRLAPDVLPHRLGALTGEYDLFINASNGDFVPGLAPTNILLVYFPLPYQTNWPARLRRRWVLMIYRLLSPLRQRETQRLEQNDQQRWPGMHLAAGWTELRRRLANPLPVDIDAILDTYQTIWSISRFTQHWLERYWQRSSRLLYPPIDVESFLNHSGDAAKQPIILSVGRFFAGQHNKKHLAMIKAFRSLVEGGLDAWKLHLAGALTPGEEHAAYLADLRSAIGSLPIQLHVDLPAAQLRSLYSQSSIYWHAAGYGEDEQRAPIKFEHFGISTVEAMAAGSVPVVFAGGGQMELVESGSNGYAWRTLTELQQATLSLIRSPELCQQLARAAAKESERFSTSQFEQRLQAELTRIGYDGSPASALVQAAKQRER